MTAESRDGVDAAALAGALDNWSALVRRNIELDIRVTAPARVVSYDPALQRAVVRLENLAVRFVGDEEVPDPPILLPSIPVRWPMAMGGLAYDTMPLLPGDPGHVHFTDRALSVWLATGNPVAPVDPLNGRTHALGDAFFEPGLHPDAEAIAPPTALDARVLEAPLIRLGVGATQAVAIASLLHTYLIAMFTAAAVAPLDGGAAFKANLLAYLGANPFTAYAATKVHAQ